MPPKLPQAPIAITHFGSSIWVNLAQRARHLVRDASGDDQQLGLAGEARKNSMPKRAMSYRAPAVAIISIVQQEVPKRSGHIECVCTQAQSFPRSSARVAVRGPLPR